MRKHAELRTTTDHASEIFSVFLRRLAQREAKSGERTRFAFRQTPAIGRSTVPVPFEHSDLHGFMHRVRMEIRRAARSRRPLSLALLRLDNTDVHDKGWAHLWNVIWRRKRETDTVARVGEHLLAVLLVDTDEVGAQAFLRDVLDRAASHVTVIVQAYPGHLFVNLARGDPTS